MFFTDSRKFLLSIVCCFLLIGSPVLGVMEFTDPTPANDTYQSTRYFDVNCSINESVIDTLNYNWNGTNYTMYNDSLVLMYNFDNISDLGENYNGNESTIVDVSSQDNNGTWITNETNETTESIWTDSGKYNGAFSFDGYDDYIDCGTDPSLKPTDNITVDVWIKSRTQESWEGIITNFQDNVHDESGYGLFFYEDSSQINITWWVQTVEGNPDNYTDYPNYALSNNNWFHITGTYDGNNLKLYINGELVDNETKSGNINWTYSPLACSIGNYYDDNEEFYFDGFIDEPRIWNRTLSAEEVYQQYVSNLNKYNSTNWNLYVNQLKNATTRLDDGSYTYQVSAIDLVGNQNQTEERNITIDSTVPTFTDIMNQTIEHGTSLGYDINATDANGISCFSVNDTTNFQINCSGYLENNTALNTGLYWLTITVNDTAGNNASTTMWVNVSDTTFPVLDFISPTPDNDTTTSNTSVEINTSITEENLNEVTYNWNATNYTMYNDSLVLMYNFDNVSGIGENYNGNESTIVDVSSQNNDGTWITNETNETTESIWTNSGKYNGAFSFDGYDDYITTDYYNEVGTLSFWFNTRDFHVNHSLFGQRYDSDEESGNWQMHWDEDGDHNLRIYAYEPGGGEMLTDKIFSLDQWYHVVVTSDGSEVNYYVNGQHDSTHTFNVELGGGGNDDFLYIGGSGENDIVESFNGMLDEVRVWNRSLSAEEVYQQYVSNLRRVNQTHWQLIVNQSKNATTDLDFGSYTYQVFADDMYDNSNSTDQRTITIVNMHAPSSFTGSATSSSSISLSWTKDTNATHTYIRYKQGSSAPTSRTDGTFLYNDTGSSTSATGLNANTMYSFTAWSYNATLNCYTSQNVTCSATSDQASSSSTPSTPAGPGNTPPVAVASVSSTGSIGDSLSFDGSSSSDADGDSLTYKWNYGDGSTGSGSSSTHTYSKAGKFYGYLEIYDGQDRDKDTFVITIVDPDADNDEDGVKDTVEEDVGSDSNETTDVENIDVVVPGGRLIDNDGDGSFDVFYDANNDMTTTLEKSDDGSYGIDTDDDGVIDYYYNPSLGYISSNEPKDTRESDNTGIILLAVALLILALLIIVLISRKKKK